MEGEIVTLRAQSELRYSGRLDLVTGRFQPDGTVQLWLQEWKPFRIVPLQLREGDEVSTPAGHRIRVLELNYHNFRPYVRLEVADTGMQSVFPDRLATREPSQPTMM